MTLSEFQKYFEKQSTKKLYFIMEHKEHGLEARSIEDGDFETSYKLVKDMEFKAYTGAKKILPIFMVPRDEPTEEN